MLSNIQSASKKVLIGFSLTIFLFLSHTLLHRQDPTFEMYLQIVPRNESQISEVLLSISKPEKDVKLIQNSSLLWPNANNPNSDRILEQIDFTQPKDIGVKKIFFARGFASWEKFSAGKKYFKNCPVSTCEFLVDPKLWREADLIIFRTNFDLLKHLNIKNMIKQRPRDQIWLYQTQEPPHITSKIKYPSVFNWTATYRRDSDIVMPYARWVQTKSQLPLVGPNIAANKTKMVAMFVSDCKARNGRLQYAKELGKYINVDIYGACGPLRCPKQKAAYCDEMLKRDYRFYLSFENSNCRDYITEKLYKNALQRNLLPIVMGAPRSDYEEVTPQNSFIHVDDFPSPAKLADYLHQLAANSSLYNSYFRWHETGHFIDLKFYCRLCAMMHDTEEAPRKTYKNLNAWWRHPKYCTTKI